MHENLLKESKNTIDKAVNILGNGGLVSIKAETVYGLAANAYSSIATDRIFKLKRRPKKKIKLLLV